jgi:hypothetical protein
VASAGCGEEDHTARTVRALERIGAKVTRDDQRAGEPVVGVSLHAAQVRDADLPAPLSELKQLESLDVGCTSVSDTGLEGVRALKHLRSLDLGCTRVSDRTLEEVGELRHLRSLDLGYTRVSDAGLRSLGRLRELDSLTLYGTQVTDAGLADLAQLQRLRTLRVGPRTTDAGLRALRPLTQIEFLDLRSTLSGAGLKQLAGLVASFRPAAPAPTALGRRVPWPIATLSTSPRRSRSLSRYSSV